MYLSVLVGAFFLFNSAFATDCSVGKDVNAYRTKTLVVDDVVFHLHFPQDRTWFTQKVIKTLKEDIPKANQYFESKPQTDVHFTTVSASESNGLATVFPYNMISLNDFPPLGNNYLNGTEEWVRNLVIHEYIHILTMDMTNGWIKGLRHVFGSVVKTNGIIPRWLNEGVAVWYESLERGQGRLNQKEVKYQVYQALKDDQFCKSIECLDTPLKYPYGHAPYWIGGEFVKYIEELNPGFLRCVFKEHSYNVPFFLNKMFDLCIGMDVEESFKSFQEFYLKTNSYLAHFCPINKKICTKLKKHKVDLTTIDFEVGSCTKGEYVLYLRRDELGRSRLYAPHKLELLNMTTGQTSYYQSNYPIESITNKDNKCIIKQVKAHGCSSSNIFSEIKIPSLKTKELLASSAIGIEIQADDIIEISYSDGDWKYSKNQKNIKTISSETRPVFNNERLSHTRSEIKVDSNEYSGSKYLTPEYFLFDYSNFANLSAFNLSTSLIDPINSHSVGISITDYISSGGESRWGGSLSYSYKTTDWRVSGDIYKSYYISSLADEIADTESAGVSLLTQSQVSNWKFYTTYGARLLNKDDFISQRDTKRLFLDMNFNEVDNDLFRKQRALNISYRLSLHSAESSEKESFAGGESHLNQSFYFGKYSHYGYSLNYGKYFKDDLKGGYLAAGGVNTFLASGYQYPMYMVSYADLIGNELVTSRGYFGSTLTNYYKGFGMLPVFIKNSGYEVGVEYAKGKYFITNDTIYSDDYATGLYAKYYLDLKLVYIWDATLSIAFSQTQYPTKINRLLFLFDAASF